MEERIQAIAAAVSGLKYSEWLKISHAINKKFASATNKVVLDDAEAIAKAIQIEVTI